MRGTMEDLKTLRIQSGKTRKEAAAALGVTANAISNYENGHRALSTAQVIPLAECYGVGALEVLEAALNSCRNAR